MSRLGKIPVKIPNGVNVEINGSEVIVKGTKGELKKTFRPEIDIKIVEDQVITSIKEDGKESNAFWGTTRSHISNMIEGVSEGFEKKMQLVGVGYRVSQNGSNGITLNIGYSHPVIFKAVDGVSIEVIDNQNIIVKGIDKEAVGLTSALIRKVRKPEPYKGKGIKYANEVIRRKAGKTAKTGA